MKKFFKFAALAALILPLMVACKTKNGPDDPKQPDEEFQEWIEEGSENEVTVSEKNLCGIWTISQTFKADSENNYLSSQLYGDPNNIHCLEIKDDNTFVDYFYNSDEGTNKAKGTWNLTGKQVTFDIEANLSDCCLPLWKQKKYMVFRCEPEELALSYSVEEPFQTRTGKDTMGIIVHYFVFKRLYELPEMPKPLEEVIVANQWKVLSDTMYLGKSVHVEDESTGFGGDLYQPVKVEQTNMLPQNAVITFAPDSTLEIKAANGDIIGKGRYDNRGRYRGYFLSTESHPELWVEIQDEDGNGDFFYNGKEIIPGLPNTLYIFVDPSNENRIIAHEEQELPANEQKDGLTLRGWVYHLEAVK